MSPRRVVRARPGAGRQLRGPGSPAVLAPRGPAAPRPSLRVSHAPHSRKARRATRPRVLTIHLNAPTVMWFRINGTRTQVPPSSLAGEGSRLAPSQACAQPRPAAPTPPSGRSRFHQVHRGDPLPEHGDQGGQSQPGAPHAVGPDGEMTPGDPRNEQALPGLPGTSRAGPWRRASGPGTPRAGLGVCASKDALRRAVAGGA